MRLLLPMAIACGASWFAATSPDTSTEKPVREKTKDLLVGKWEEPQAAGQRVEVRQGGTLHRLDQRGGDPVQTESTYWVLDDGSLELRVRVGHQPGEPFKLKMKVTKERLTFLDEKGVEDSYQRAK